MNRVNNMWDSLDEGDKQFPKGEYGADGSLKDPETAARVKSFIRRRE